jgi:hypothetical protein
MDFEIWILVILFRVFCVLGTHEISLGSMENGLYSRREAKGVHLLQEADGKER